MVAPSKIVPTGLLSVPKPEQLRADLKALYKQCKLIRRLLAISETVHEDGNDSAVPGNRFQQGDLAHAS